MKKCKSFLLGFFTAAILLGLALPAIAAGGTVTWDSVFVGAKIVIDGETLQPKDVNGKPVDAVIYKGTTYVPVRSVANAFGASVDWDQSTRTVYLKTEQPAEPEPAEPQPTEPTVPDNPPAPSVPPADTRSPAEVSEAAMENFLRRIQAGNYTVECESGEVKASVCSENLVYYSRVIWDEGLEYDGFAIMTVNGNETFEGYLGEDGLTRITFLQEGKAIDAAADGASIQDQNSKLPNWWINVSDGNIWELFYNDIENPLRFVSSADEVKALVKLYGNIGNIAMPRMQEVWLELDAEMPTCAHLRTSFSEGYPNISDVDILISFGNAVADPRAVAWMRDPNRTYPEAPTEWGVDEIHLNAIFLPGYGLTAVPFPDYATYAFTLDENAVLEEDAICVRDAKATEGDMLSYAEKLQNMGFTPVTEADGKTDYRLLLREEYQCYSSICLEYDQGVNLTARKYYACPQYSGLDEVNAQITAAGFAALPADGNLSGFTGEDRANEIKESWLYFFDYQLGMFVDFRYADRSAAEAYVQSYIASLTGFEPDDSGEYAEYEEAEDYLGAEEAVRFAALQDEDIFYRYATPEGQWTFKYRFNEDGETVSFLYKAEKFIAPDEIKSRLAAVGFPEIDLDACSSCRDFRQFRKVMYDQDLKLDLSLSMTFESPEEAEALLDQYIALLRDENDFEIFNPTQINMDKQIAYAKEADGSLLVFGLNYYPESAFVSIEFRAV